MDGAAYDLQRAREIWNRIQPWPAEEQRAYLGRSVSFGSPALFNLLRRMSREIGLHDRKRAVHIAELALHSVLGSRQHLSDSFWDLKAQAWAWVANARRLARDRLGAEEALSAAEEAWRQPRTSYDLTVEAEILAIKSCQRLLQGEQEEAIDLLNRALPEFRRGGSSLLLGHFLIHRAILLIRIHEPEEATSDLVEVYELLKGHREPSQLHLATLGDLARLLAHLGHRREAAATLRQAEALSGSIGEPLQRCRLAWAQGVLQVCMDEIDAAERSFISLREEFTAMQSEGCLATVTLDLALLYQRQGRHGEIIPLVRAALPILDRFPYRKRALGSLNSLRRAEKRGEISLHLLQEIHLLSLPNTL